MKNNQIFPITAVCTALFFTTIGCNTPKPDTANKAVAKPDMAAIKAEIQAKETAFAAAQTSGDVDGVAAFYADDAVSMGDGQPAGKGKEAIKKEVLARIDNHNKGAVTTYDVEDVYGSEDQVTEVGKTTIKDATGNVTYTGKYMAVWEKRKGEYICIRDISNSDASQSAAVAKSIHVFDMPNGVSEAQWASEIKELNAVIAGIGYPNAGYTFYKTSDNSVKNNRYYFEGVWPAGDGYKKIHEHPKFLEASKKMDPLYAKIKAVEMYRKLEKVN